MKNDTRTTVNVRMPDLGFRTTVSVRIPDVGFRTC